jgi:hypothetical protein
VTRPEELDPTPELLDTWSGIGLIIAGDWNVYHEPQVAQRVLGR